MAVQAVSLDHRGDLLLRVGEDGPRRDFIVCSRTVARVSSVWNRMLFGYWAKSKPHLSGTTWMVELPDDDVAAMHLILKITHNKPDEVPDLLSLDELFDITVLSDKYDLTRQLKPWASQWIKPFKCCSYAAAKAVDNEKLLWISWELGDNILFHNTTRELLLYSKLSSMGELQLPPSAQVSTLEHIPPGIIGNRSPKGL